MQKEKLGINGDEHLKQITKTCYENIVCAKHSCQVTPKPSIQEGRGWHCQLLYSNVRAVQACKPEGELILKPKASIVVPQRSREVEIEWIVL